MERRCLVEALSPRLALLILWLFTPMVNEVFDGNWLWPLHGRESHSAVHVAYEDVEAYLAWSGKSRPTEAAWELAARGGLEGAAYAWGNELAARARHLANTWQSELPHQKLLEDEYEGTSPVGSFPPNGYGLFNRTGNVWEWCADWFSTTFHAHGSRRNPKGPPCS
jgi:formylglycine-generating enzyme required for sulfatase activity